MSIHVSIYQSIYPSIQTFKNLPIHQLPTTKPPSHLNSLRDLVDILWLNDSFNVVFKDLCEVVLKLRASKVGQNVSPVW